MRPHGRGDPGQRWEGPGREGIAGGRAPGAWCLMAVHRRSAGAGRRCRVLLVGHWPAPGPSLQAPQ